MHTAGIFAWSTYGYFRDITNNSAIPQMLGIIVIHIIKIEERLYISTSFISLLIKFNHKNIQFFILQKCLFYLVWYNIILWLYSEYSGHITVIIFTKLLYLLSSHAPELLFPLFYTNCPLVECYLTRSLMVNRIPSWFYLCEAQLPFSDSHHSCKYLYQNLIFKVLKRKQPGFL